MRNRFALASTFALAITLLGSADSQAAYTNSDGIIITNGVVLITTRTAIDAFWRQQSTSSLWDADDAPGPGTFSPGDAQMGELLEDYGYSVRMVPERVLWWTTTDWLGNPTWPLTYYQGGGGPSSTTSNVLWSAMLVIMSGSGSSGDMAPPNTNGIPIITGEHTTLGDSTTAPGSHAELFLYSNKKSGNITITGGNGITGNPGLYMRVWATNHPIMQGIPLDSQNRVQIFRDPYPEETLHNARGGKSNYEISWTGVDINQGASVPAPGLTVIGTLDAPYTNQVVFSVLDAGAHLAPDTSDAVSPWSGYTTAPSRLVHFFVNEGGSGNCRRSFNALTAWGRIIFVRTCKWAMGETLSPYQGFKIIDMGQISPSRIKLTWQDSLKHNYRIDGTTDFKHWLPIVDSITNQSRTLDISSAPQALYLRVAAFP
jgi:hypothetical protein